MNQIPVVAQVVIVMFFVAIIYLFGESYVSSRRAKKELEKRMLERMKGE